MIIACCVRASAPVVVFKRLEVLAGLRVGVTVSVSNQVRTALVITKDPWATNHSFCFRKYVVKLIMAIFLWALSLVSDVISAHVTSALSPSRFLSPHSTLVVPIRSLSPHITLVVTFVPIRVSVVSVSLSFVPNRIDSFIAGMTAVAPSENLNQKVMLWGLFGWGSVVSRNVLLGWDVVRCVLP